MSNTRVSKRSRQFFEQMVAIGRLRTIRDPLADAIEDMNLTAPQGHAIMWLGIETQMTMGVLARRAGVTEKSITGIIDRLEAMGVAERVRSTEDRRAVSVVLTEKGQKLHGEVMSHCMDSVEQFLELLGPEDEKLLLGIVQRLEQKMTQLAANASATGD